MADFFATRMGAKFFERDLPNLIEAFSSIARSLELLAGSTKRRAQAMERPGCVWVVHPPAKPGKYSKTIVVGSALAVSRLIVQQIDEDFQDLKSKMSIELAEMRNDVIAWGEREAKNPGSSEVKLYNHRVQMLPIVT